jgi:Copper type II ascorbate-dependent monooxygenase, N-terminal domain/Copper type II ascorbate-dependent monooxygenase, C-terminal domain
MTPRGAPRAPSAPGWALGLLLATACSVDSTSTNAGTSADKASASAELPEGDITYYQHVKPLLDAKCVRCHVEGTVAPFALDTYDLAQRFAEFARRAIDQGTMPPWLFDGECNDYRGDLSLSEAEKRLFGAWVDQGKLEGDPKKPGAPLDVDDLRLSREDVTLMMPEAFTPNTTGEKPDEYRCFPVAWPEDITTQKFVTGFRALPGNAKVVHHVEVYRVSAAEAQAAFAKDEADPGLGYECFSGPGLGQGTIGGWAPGSEGYDYPEGVGVPVEPGSVFVIQVHYNTAANGGPAPDQSGVAFKVDDEAIAGGYNFWTNPIWTALPTTMNIPAGDEDVPVTFTADPTVLAGSRAIEIHMAALHMHNLGKSGFMYLRKANGERKCIIEIPRWDFHWQAGARLRVPVQVQPGDTIEMECRFDNSAEHQPVIAGVQQKPRRVTWGENTSDEMCLGVLLWSPLLK